MVYILGCDHCLQEYELQDRQDEIRKIERQLEEKFYSVTEEIILNQAIEFIGEECKPGQNTIPRKLATELGCEYAEIDMNSEERERKAIPKGYERLGSDEQKRCNGLREDYMLERTYRESTLETSKLILCGALHVEGLANRFASEEKRLLRETC